MQVSTGNNGSASDVTVALSAQPSGQQATFTGGCAKGAGAATCMVSSVSDKQPAILHAQIPVAASASTVTSVQLTATASIVTSAKWTPPSAAETVAVTSATAAPASSPAASLGKRRAGDDAAARADPEPQRRLELAHRPRQRVPPVPRDQPGGDAQRRAGDAAFGGKRNAKPVSDSSALAFGQPGLTGHAPQCGRVVTYRRVEGRSIVADRHRR